jgi:hypothetical protein
VTPLAKALVQADSASVLILSIVPNVLLSVFALLIRASDMPVDVT